VAWMSSRCPVQPASQLLGSTRPPYAELPQFGRNTREAASAGAAAAMHVIATATAHRQ
jgi:hypothetical protein